MKKEKRNFISLLLNKNLKKLGFYWKLKLSIRKLKKKKNYFFSEFP